jgi:putative hydrolase of the HAD superfamily
MNKALFWDFDGTLAYCKRGWTKSMADTLEFFGYTFDYQDVKAHMSAGFTWHGPEKDYTNVIGDKWWDFIFRYLNKLYVKLNITGDFDELNNHLRDIFLSPDNYVLYDDTEPTLKKCRQAGFKNFILSNNYPELYEIVKALGLGGYFDGCVVSANIGFEKPRKEIFEYALKAAGYPDSCYMIGDNPDADVKGAKAAGIPAILVHTPGPGGADFSFKNLTGVAELLAGRENQ